MSDILKQVTLVRREVFDPTNQEHLESFKLFLHTGAWGAVQFYPEVPHIEVPMTVLVKFAKHHLAGIDVAVPDRNLVKFPLSETRAQQAVRLAAANKTFFEALEKA